MIISYILNVGVMVRVPEKVSFVLLQRCPRQIAGLDLRHLPGIKFHFIYYPANFFVTLKSQYWPGICVICEHTCSKFFCHLSDLALQMINIETGLGIMANCTRKIRRHTRRSFSTVDQTADMLV